MHAQWQQPVNEVQPGPIHNPRPTLTPLLQLYTAATQTTPIWLAGY